jgi:hypothetical protein
MKNYYDKVLFILALALLGLGVAYCFMKGGLPSGVPPQIVQQAPNGGAYQPLPTALVKGEPSVWEAGGDEYSNTTGIPSDLWYYGVFTPPKIWWDPTSGWTAEAPKPPRVIPPFGLHLDNLEQRLYRVQFQSYTGAADATAHLQMQDTANNSFFDTKVGLENPDEAVKVLDFKMVRQTLPDGTSYRVATITLLDERTNQTLSLTQGQQLTLPNDRYFLLETESPLTPQKWEVTKVGDSLDVGVANFTITKVDYDAPSVTVEKDWPTGSKEDKQELTLTPTPSSPDASTSATPTPPAADAGATSAPAAN